jgi:hypothetical protein
MKKEAGINIGGLVGDGICALIGAETEGAGFGLCETVKKGIGDIISQGQSAIQSGERELDIIKARKRIYQNLANTIRAVDPGCTDPKYTDPLKLQLFFEGSDGGNMLAGNGPEGAFEIAKGLKNFLVQGAFVKAKYPDFVNKSLDWVFNYYQRSGYDVKGTLQQLQKLEKEATNPIMVNYVIDIINNNYFGAIMFKLMMSVGKKDLSSVRKEYGETMQSAIDILGKRSLDVLNIDDAMNETAKATFDKLALSEKAYNIHLNLARERAQFERELVKSVGPWILYLIDHPYWHNSINKLAVWGGLFGPKGIAGQALSQIGKQT